MREDGECPGTVEHYLIAFAIIVDHIRMQNEGYLAEVPANVVRKGALGVEHQPELGVSVSGAADFDLADPKECRFRVFLFGKECFQPLLNLRGKDDLQHGSP
jgi:hypothetical protein